MKCISGFFTLLILLICERTPAACEPGRQVACACLGGTSGVQACREDGRGYEPCQCPTSPRPGAAQTVVVAKKDELVACPANFVTLADRLTPRGDGDRESPSNEEREAQKCAPGLFPKPGWVIVFRRGLGYHRIIVDAATKKVIARAKVDHYGGSHSISVTRLATIDFDGDGASEILEDLVGDGRGYEYENLGVFRVSGARLDSAFSAPLLLDNSAAEEDSTKVYRYTASYEVTKEPDGRRGLVVIGKMPQGSRSSDGSGAPLVIGTKRFTWRGGRLVTN